MLTTTRDMIMPTAITGSYPRPLWFDASLDGRPFKAALGNSLFREQYLDAVAAIINAQEAAGLDIVTDGDSRFDLAVGGKSWFFYPIERLGSRPSGWSSPPIAVLAARGCRAASPITNAYHWSPGPTSSAASWVSPKPISAPPTPNSISPGSTKTDKPRITR